MPEPEDNDIVIRARVPLSGLGFRFTMSELRVMHRRLHLTLRASACRHYRDDSEAQDYNRRSIWKALMALHKGCVNPRVPPTVMADVYEAARVTYGNAIHLGRDDAEARRQALTAAQLPLEKYFDFPSEYECDATGAEANGPRHGAGRIGNA